MALTGKLLASRALLRAAARAQQRQQLVMASPLLTQPLRPVSLTSSCRVLGLQEKPTKVTIPEASPGGMLSKSQHWTIERALTIAMVPLYPAALLCDGLAMNLAVSAAITMHVYWGIEAVIKDYAMERLYGPSLQKILYAVWKVVSLIGFAGFVYFCYTDVGFVRVVKDLWTV